MLITEDPMTVECGAAMEALFLCFGLCVCVQLDSLSYCLLKNNCILFKIKYFICFFRPSLDRISGVMVSELASNVVVRGLSPGQAKQKDYKIGTRICCFSAKHTEEVRAKNGWLKIRMCPRAATCTQTIVQ